jgi:DEAD/DEAH box helicase domain-containing protein
MIPSVIGAQVRRGIEEFLRTTFPVTNPFFAGALDELLARPGEVFRGPYISLKLPFQSSASSRRFFPDVVPESFHPFRHQEQAWERLDWRAGLNTIVATGTASGKTECFLYPILDYCCAHRHRRGIKAILIYPMNALATDQAGRIAEAIYASIALRGRVTAGLYIGEQDSAPQVAMTESRVITHKDSMRHIPPDILLTNYKMLDYLLVRPDDRGLWRENGPDTLRYLVVDELHTFDGAQGADVASLIRRIKARLRTPARQLICVGTSATLGSSGEADAQQTLAAYATRIFGEPFEAAGVIGEVVQSPEEFLSADRVLYAGIPGPEAADQLDPLGYESPEAYLEAQQRLWFGASVAPSGSEEWKLELGRQLRSHALLRRLLALAGARRGVCRTSRAALGHAAGVYGGGPTCGGADADEFPGPDLGGAHTRQGRPAGAPTGALSVLDARAGTHGVECGHEAHVGLRLRSQAGAAAPQFARRALSRVRPHRLGLHRRRRVRASQSGSGHLLPRLLRFPPGSAFPVSGRGPEPGRATGNAALALPGMPALQSR